MRFPVLKKKLSQIPRLKDLKAVKEYPEQNREKVVKYACLVYDPSSEYVSSYPNLLKRKDAVAKECKMSTSLANSLVSMEDEAFVALAVELLKEFNDREWSLIIMNEECFLEWKEKIMSRVYMEKDKDELAALEIKNKLLKGCDEINNRLKEYYNAFYANDDGLLKAAEAARAKRFNPEAIANRSK